jgi:hypothetical protein
MHNYFFIIYTLPTCFDLFGHHQGIQQANTIHQNLIFNYTLETNNAINFLDLFIIRTNSKFLIDIYRKPTTTNTIIHYHSNHSQEHEMAAFRFLINRMQRLPLNPQQKQIEWTNILHIAETNGYPITVINKLNAQIQKCSQHPKKAPKQKPSNGPYSFSIAQQ